MAGKKGRSEPLVVGWMTHSLLVDDPPNDPQYGVEHLADKSWYREVWWAPVCHGVSDGLVFKAMMACLKILQIFMANVFPFCFVPFFFFSPHFAYLFEDFCHICSMM